MLEGPAPTGATADGPGGVDAQGLFHATIGRPTDVLAHSRENVRPLSLRTFAVPRYVQGGWGEGKRARSAGIVQPNIPAGRVLKVPPRTTWKAGGPSLLLTILISIPV